MNLLLERKKEDNACHHQGRWHVPCKWQWGRERGSVPSWRLRSESVLVLPCVTREPCRGGCHAGLEMTPQPQSFLALRLLPCTTLSYTMSALHMVCSVPARCWEPPLRAEFTKFTKHINIYAPYTCLLMSVFARGGSGKTSLWHSST